MSRTIKKSKRKRSPNFELKCAIIQEVKKRPPLWNECDINWKNAEVYCQLWNEIGEIMGCPGSTVRSKWTNLKDRYNSEVLKELEGYRNNCVYKSKWPYYKAMKFLDSHYDQGMNSPRANRGQTADEIMDLCDLCQNYLESEAGPSQKMMFSNVCNNHSNDLNGEQPEVQSIKVYAEPKNQLIRTIPEVCQDPDQQMVLPVSKASSTRTNQMKEKVGACSDRGSQFARPNFEDKGDDQIIKVQQGRTGKMVPNGPSPERIIKNIGSPKASADEKCAKILSIGDELKKNPNYQFLMSLLPYLDQLDQTECLEVRSQIQCIINEAFKRRQHPGIYYPSYY